MPEPNEILRSLSAISNSQRGLAIIWHVLLAGLVLALVFGWRPTKRLGAAALALPLLSVGVVAWLYENPFNGTVFVSAALALAVIGIRLPAVRAERPPVWASVIGVGMVAFGWVYPHFLEDASWTAYLYRAPTGLVPCPTLSLVVGFALLANGFSSRLWSIVLGILGAFYALFGALRLGVTIDFGLLIGAAVLLALRRSPSR